MWQGSRFDAAALMAPISNDMPCGRDLRADGAGQARYYVLKELRRTARDAERRQLLEEDLIVPEEWHQLHAALEEILSRETKDLELAAWYIEAAVRLEGFGGLASGYQVATYLIEQWWDKALWPAADGDDPVDRLLPLLGLNGLDGPGTLIQPLLSIPLFGAGDAAVPAWRLERRATDQDDEVQRLIAAMAPLKLPERLREIEAAVAAYADFVALLDSRFGPELPTSHIRTTLERCRHLFRQYAARYVPAEQSDVPGAPSAAASPGVAASAGETGACIASEVVTRTRDEALQTLREIALWFRTTEPHSPASYALEQVLRWSDMPLPALLTELVGDEAARQQLFRLTGIRQDAATPS